MKNIIKYIGIVFIISFSSFSVYHALEYANKTPEDKITYSYTTFFEERFTDLRENQTLHEKKVNDKLVLADIDEYSLKHLNSWPIDREHWATMIRKLRDYGAKVIAFDVFIAEDSKTCNGLNPDEELEKAIAYFKEKENNSIIFPYTTYEQDAIIAHEHDDNSKPYLKEMPDEILFTMINAKSSGDADKFDIYENVIAEQAFPIQRLLDAEVNLGFITAEPDADGINRQYKTVSFIKSNHNEKDSEAYYVPSYGLLAFQDWIGENDSEDEELEQQSNSTETKFKTQIDARLENNPPVLVTKNGDIHISMFGKTKIRWSGDENKFKRVPIYDIISGAIDNEELKRIFDGALVFVGSTSFAADDLRHTPINAYLPGVFSHMNFVQMLIDGNFAVEPSVSTEYSWYILIISTMILLLVQLRENPILDLFVLITIVSSITYIDTYYLIKAGYEIKLFWCFFCLTSCYAWNTIVNFYMANQDKAFLKTAFGSYISPELIDEMYDSGDAPSLGGVSGIRTAYFTDIQGFSSFSEKLSASELVELLNEYLTVMTDILLDEKGTLDKYEGDAIIAFFGAPMELVDHAHRSCMVAHRMQEALLILRDKWVSEGEKWPKIVHQMRMRIGINSGEMVTGNMGSASRMNYTMMGDAVNLAARLEESAKQYGIFTQVSKETRELAGDDFVWRELDTIKVVGKSIPVTTYELLGLMETAPSYLKDLGVRFEYGIELYKSQKWNDALIIFQETLDLEYKRFPELKGIKTNPSEIYIKRCEDYKNNPPEKDWDGIFTLTSK